VLPTAAVGRLELFAFVRLPLAQDSDPARAAPDTGRFLDRFGRWTARDPRHTFASLNDRAR
jgi:hypothetical protein